MYLLQRLYSSINITWDKLGLLRVQHITHKMRARCCAQDVCCREWLTWICLLVEPVQAATVLRTCLRSADPTNRTVKVSAKTEFESM